MINQYMHIWDVQWADEARQIKDVVCIPEKSSPENTRNRKRRTNVHSSSADIRKLPHVGN